jgi:RNA polymerase sigma-70 factor, ECF subfamily
MLEPIEQIRRSAEPGGIQLGRPAAGRAEPETLPDLLLIERARTSDVRAIEALIRRYGRRLFRVARSVLPDEESAESAVREAYLAAFADLSRYEPAGKFAAWLGRLAFVQARAARAQARSASASSSFASASASFASGSSPGASVESPSHAELERAIDALPEVFRTVFVLRVVEGISGIETAASLGLHQTTVRTRLYRALRRLSPEVVTRMRTTPALLALSPERIERVTRRVIEGLPQGSMLSISASPP